MADNKVDTAEELDVLIAAWEGDVSTIRSNITLLKETLAYQLLQSHGTPGGRELKGTTLQLVPPAFAAIRRMDANWAKLQTFVAEQKTARTQLPRWGQKAKVEEIAAKFNSESIIMEVREIPLAQRTATSGDKVTVKTSASKLKDQINADFMVAKKPLLDVDTKWEKLNPQFGTQRALVEEIRGKFQTAGLSDAPELEALVKRFNTIDGKYKTDPLGCPEDISKELRSYVETANQRLQAEEQRILREQEAVALKLASAKERLEELKALRLSALELHAKAVAEIHEPQALGLSAPGSTKQLSEWLDSLETALGNKLFDSVSSGLTDWYIEFNQLKHALEAVIAANEAVNQRRADLVKRWEKAKRKYNFHKADLGESKSLSKFAEIAEAALTGKIKLDEAERAIESYEVKLGELIAHKDQHPPQS